MNPEGDSRIHGTQNDISTLRNLLKGSRELPFKIKGLRAEVLAAALGENPAPEALDAAERVIAKAFSAIQKDTGFTKEEVHLIAAMGDQDRLLELSPTKYSGVIGKTTFQEQPAKVLWHERGVAVALEEKSSRLGSRYKTVLALLNTKNPNDLKVEDFILAKEQSLRNESTLKDARQGKSYGFRVKEVEPELIPATTTRESFLLMAEEALSTIDFDPVECRFSFPNSPGRGIYHSGEYAFGICFVSNRSTDSMVLFDDARSRDKMEEHLPARVRRKIEKLWEKDRETEKRIDILRSALYQLHLAHRLNTDGLLKD